MLSLTEEIAEIKSNIDLRLFISSLGFEVDSSGKVACPFHNEKTPSMMIYDRAFKCFGGGCGEHGDLFDFYMKLNPGVKLIEAVNFAAEAMGLPTINTGNFSDGNRTQTVERMMERKLVENIYELATQFHSNQLDSYPDILEFAQEKWGFGREILDKYRIGIAPRKLGALKGFLAHKGILESDMLKSGLFYQTTYGVSEVFRDLIVFPYIIARTPKYFIGRKPRIDSADRELYPERDKPRPKYKKMLVYNESSRDYVSKSVGNNYLYGEDAIYNQEAKRVIITEGITDAIHGMEMGFHMISPVTTRLRTQDFEKYMPFFKKKSSVLISNDNEASRAGIEGSRAVADILEENGVYVKIVILPRPEGVEKVDLNDFLKEARYPAEEYQALIDKAITPMTCNILELDKGMDEIERTREIMGLEKYWLRTVPADIISYVKQCRRHFDNMSSAQERELVSMVKAMKKEHAKNVKVDAPDIDKSNFSLKDKIDDLLYADDKSRLPNKVADLLYEHLENNGAKFYADCSEGISVFYFDDTLYTNKDVKYFSFFYDVAGISKEVTWGRQSLDCLFHKIQIQGQKISSFCWVNTCSNGTRYINLSGSAESKIIKMEPGKLPEAVPNGCNKDNVVLASPHGTEKFTYDPNVDVAEAMSLYKELIFDNMACTTENKYMISSWLLTSLFVDVTGTRPHLRLEGPAGSGKTTAAKMLTALLFGMPRHQNGSTIAAIYESSKANPIVCLDNLENKDMDDSKMNFIIASATAAARQKKGGPGYDSLVEQVPQCMVMTTGIEPIHRNELIQRSLCVGFDNSRKRNGFLERHTLTEIRKQRNKILSGIIKMASSVYDEFDDYSKHRDLSEAVQAEYKDNPKIRNIEALCFMFLILSEISKHIRVGYDFMGEFVDPDFVNPKNLPVGEGYDFNRDVFRTWMESQGSDHDEMSSDTNQVLFLLDALERKSSIGGFDENYFSQELSLDVRIIAENFVMHTSSTALHGALSKLKREGLEYDMRSHLQLSRRLTDSKDILRSAGWCFGKYRSRTSRHLVIFKFSGNTDREHVKDHFPKVKWE